MGRKKNKERDQFDISVEEQLALLSGENVIYNDDYDMGEGADPTTIEDSMESALLEKINQSEDDKEIVNKLKEMLVIGTELPQEIQDRLMKDNGEYHSKIEIEDVPKFKFMRAKFSKEMKTLCISNNKQMFSICLDNYPTFDNDINNEIEVITMVRDAAIRKMLTCFEPTAIINVEDFEKEVCTQLDNLGKDVHVFTYDDEDMALVYELSNTFMDAIDDAIEIAIEEGKLFPMFAALMDLPNNRYFKCDFDRLIMKGIELPTNYIEYLMTKHDVEVVGEEVINNIEKFKAIDIDDIDDVCSKSMDIVNRIMNKLWNDDDNEEVVTGE